jgi:hypothetical protein
MRVAEIMNDFRTLQFHIAQHRMEPAPEEYWEEGYVVMRQCAAESQAILATHFNPGSIQGAAGDGEIERMQLQRFVSLSSLACSKASLLTAICHPGLSSTQALVDSKRIRSIFELRLRHDGPTSGIKSFKVLDLTVVMLPRWPLSMRHSDLSVPS